MQQQSIFCTVNKTPPLNKHWWVWSNGMAGYLVSSSYG